MGQHLVGLVEVAQFLGIVSRGKRPGNRLWELLKSFKRKRPAYQMLKATRDVVLRPMLHDQSTVLAYEKSSTSSRKVQRSCTSSNWRSNAPGKPPSSSDDRRA